MKRHATYSVALISSCPEGATFSQRSLRKSVGPSLQHSTRVTMGWDRITPANAIRRGRRVPRASGRSHSIPRPALRRRYADAPAGAPRCALRRRPEARRRFPPAPKRGLLAVCFIECKAVALRLARLFSRDLKPIPIARRHRQSRYDVRRDLTDKSVSCHRCLDRASE